MQTIESDTSQSTRKLALVSDFAASFENSSEKWTPYNFNNVNESIKD